MAHICTQGHDLLKHFAQYNKEVAYQTTLVTKKKLLMLKKNVYFDDKVMLPIKIYE